MIMENNNKTAKEICNCEYCRSNGTLLCDMIGGCVAYRTVLQLLYYKHKRPSEELINKICGVFFDAQEYIKRDNLDAFEWIHKQLKTLQD
jgi:hypothetical protein